MSRVNSCRCHAASTFGRNTPDNRSGDNPVTTPSSSTPAVCTTAVNGCPTGTDAKQPRHGSTVRHITGHHVHLRTQPGQLLTESVHTLRRRTTPRHQQQTPHPTRRHQMTRHLTPQTTRPTSDQDRALGIPARRHRQHDLAHMPRLTHETERLTRPTHIPRTHRKRPQRPLREQAEEFAQHLAGPVRPRLAEVEGAVPHVTDRVRVADVGLAHLQEPAAGSGDPQRRVHEVTRQRVQDHVHPLRHRDTSRNFSSKPRSREDAM